MNDNNIEKENSIDNCEETIQENNSITHQENEEEIKETTKKCKINQRCLLKTVLYVLLFVAIAILYLLHFMGDKKETNQLGNAIANNGSTVMLTVNNDSIIKHFTLAELLKNDLGTEANKYQQELRSRQSVFEEKYKNFQINIKNNVLTQTQIQNAENQLQQEAATLQALQEQSTYPLATKEESVQREIADSIINATKRVNDRKYKADYVLATATGSAIIYANKVYDITDEVIKELNDAYKKSSKK